MTQNKIVHEQTSICEYGECCNSPIVTCPVCDEDFCGNHYSGMANRCLECVSSYLNEMEVTY